MPWDDPWFLPENTTPHLHPMEFGWEIAWPNHKWKIDDVSENHDLLIIDENNMIAFEFDVQVGELKFIPPGTHQPVL